MAGQFDKYVKILGNGSRPDRFQGVPEQYAGDPNAVPDMVVPPLLTVEDTINVGGKDKNITRSAVNVAQGRKADLAARDLELQRKELRGNARKRQAQGLSTTTMRLNEKTGEAYDTEENKPAPSGRVMPTRQANPKYLAADAQRRNEDIAAETEADDRRSGITKSDEYLAEQSFNKSEKTKGSNTRSVNGVTFDARDYQAEGPEGIRDTRPLQPSPSLLQSSTFADSQAEAQAKSKFRDYEKPSGKVSDYKPTKSKGDLAADKSEALLAQGARIADKKDKEGPTTVDYGDTLSPENKSVTNPYDEKGNVKPEYNNPNNIYSTTMSEQNGEIVEGGIQKAPYTKPENWTKPTKYPKPVAPKPRVLPASVLNTSGTERIDVRQAEIERRLHVANKTMPTKTTVLDPNELPARPQAGQTPEAGLIAAAKRETRATNLAAEGKEMTTVAPEVMATAKRLGKTSMYNLTPDYMNQTAFLSHEAIQKATVAHAFGVHDLLGTENDKLHQYLGGSPLLAKSRLATAYKIVDRNRRGLPEKNAGEFDVLRGMVHAGTNASKTRRGLVQGKTSKVIVNGQSVTLAEGSPENRALTHAKASKVVDETEAAPKSAIGVGTPYAPEAGLNRYGKRKVGEPLEKAELTDFSPAELRNKKMVPGADDSKAKMGPVEKEVTSEAPTVAERLKKGPKNNTPKEKAPVTNTFAKVTGTDFLKQSAERQNLKSTTMRLNEKGEAYDTEDKK